MLFRTLHKKIERLHQECTDYQHILKALNTSNAVIEFSPDGVITAVNPNFCQVTGYSADELIGQHHRIFCDPVYRNSAEYQQFWHNLAQGHYFSGTVKRVDKANQALWLEASYNPVLNDDGQVEKVFKIAAEVTDQIQRLNEQASLLNALNLSV